METTIRLFVAPLIRVAHTSEIEIDEVRLKQRQLFYEEIVRGQTVAVVSDHQSASMVTAKKKVYKLENFGFDIPGRRVEVEVYIDSEFMKSFEAGVKREAAIRKYISDRSAWFFSYGTRGVLRGY